MPTGHAKTEAERQRASRRALRAAGALATLLGAAAACDPGEDKEAEFLRILPLCSELFAPGAEAPAPGS